MKNFITIKMILIFIGLLSISCSSDQENKQVSATKKTMLKTGATNPENPLNPYDLAGRAHSEILDAYFDTAALPETLEQVIARIGLVSLSNNTLQEFSATPGSLISTARAQYILTQPQNAIPSIFNQVACSERARNSFKNFSESLVSLCATEQNYNVIYKYISDYEALILNDALLTEADKKLILTSTSIARYAASKKRRPKRNMDTDWEINIFHVAGSIEGYTQSPATAVTTSLCLGIAANK